MRRTLVPRFLATLELSSMSDEALHTLAADIVQAAKTSPLVAASPTMQACVATLAARDAALASCNETVAADRAKLHVDIGAEALARADFLGIVRTYSTLVTSDARSYADVHTAGLPARGPRAPRNAAPTVPTGITNHPPRTGHGMTRVVVEETGPTKHKYVAQQSLNGVDWTQLGVGNGKTRVVTGASGTQVWVRFAMVRGQRVSDWSIPIQVTIP